MGKQRKKWPANLKQTIVLKVLKGEEPVAGIAKRYEVSEPLVYKWKEQFLQGSMNALSNKNESSCAALQNENDCLKRLLAEKELALDITKKLRGL